MSKKFYLPFLMAVVIAFTGCKKMGPLSADLFTVTPSPLEAIGGQVPATIDGKFPAKYFDKKTIVTLTPYLVYEGGETAGTSYTFQGESVQGNNQTISYKEGGNFSMKSNFTYIPAMRKSTLMIEAKLTKGSKTTVLPRFAVAEGVVSTSEISDAGAVKAAIAADKFQRIIAQNYIANIMYLIQQADVRNNQMKSEEMKALQAELKAAMAAANRQIAGINISSYASPDGGMDLNEELAQKREDNSTNFLNKQLKKDKITADIVGEFTAEDWAGFQELVSKSDIQDKELILRVLSMYTDPEQRETEIKNMSATFKVLADQILPQLRRSKINATINLIGKSDDELKSLAKSDAKALNVEELLYAANLLQGADKKAAYQSAVNIYPNDFRAYNNLGMIAYAEGNVTDAENWFQKAAKANSNAPEVQMNQGLIELKKGNLGKAETSFGKAAGVSELSEAMGVLYLEKGEYAKAVNAFGNAKTNNAALAQILNKDYNKAKSTLSEIASPNATTYYLTAVLGARTNNESMVIKNLTEVNKLDKAMAKQALTDLEFAKINVASVVK